MNTSTHSVALRTLWQAEYDHPFAGWDFSYLDGRRVTLRPDDTWDYAGAVHAALMGAPSLLDMDTGGGEWLAQLPHRPPLTAATEGYAPNVQVARQRLEPLGVTVHDVSDASHLPFDEDTFAVITNRHGAYDPLELRRVLTPNGIFITQQVGSETNRRLHELLDAPFHAAQWDLSTAVHALQAAGLRVVEQREEFPVTRYFDVGAIAYYLKAIPWQIPDFSVDRYFRRLLAIHALIEREGYVDVLFHQFFMRAQRP